MANKVDSNVTGLRFAEELTLKTLPGTPDWYPLEPNSYKNFGGQLSTMARKPINPTRQQKKGTVTSIEASGGFNTDWTQNNLTRLLQGVMFADLREKPTTAPINGVAVVLTGATATTYAAAAGLSIFLTNHLLKASGFVNSANNGLKLVTTATATTVTTTGNAVETPTAAAKLEAAGYQFASATLDVQVVGGLVRLNRASGVVDFTTLGLVVGEWVYVGGDAAGLRFTNNQGFARVYAVAATTIDLDKIDWAPQAEIGAAKTIQLFFGNVLKNEATTALIKRRTYNVERQLGADANGTMSEYLVGAVANQFALDIKQADKIVADIDFVALDNEQRDGVTGVKSGNRPSLTSMDAFNTSSDFSRIKLAKVDSTNPAPTPMFAYATDLKLTVNNNVAAIKALGVLGAFDTSTGMFSVTGSLTAYFADVAAVQAVRNNQDVTLDVVMAKNNSGIAMDVPLLSLGDGQLKVEMDKPITIPLNVEAAESAAGYTLMFCFFPYLPTVAM